MDALPTIIHFSSPRGWRAWAVSGAPIWERRTNLWDQLWQWGLTGPSGGSSVHPTFILPVDETSPRSTPRIPLVPHRKPRCDLGTYRTSRSSHQPRPSIHLQQPSRSITSLVPTGLAPQRILTLRLWPSSTYDYEEAVTGG